MKQQNPKKIKKNLITTRFTSLINITMVLILLGLLSFVLINNRKLSEYIREKIGFTLVLKDNLNDAELVRLQKVISANSAIKSIKYIDKETAANDFTKDLGDDFRDFLGYNPLFASIDVKLYAPFTNGDSLKSLEQKFLKFPEITDVYYQKNLVTLINQNVRKISITILVVSLLLTIIFFGLINNTIRLQIYSQRFIINTMQMVGATNNFIRKPFLLKSVILGFYGSLIASVVLICGIYFYKKELNGLVNYADLTTVLMVVIVVFLFGFIISVLSTWFALNKFLRLKFDELFY
jgi:cell division transport system permease protein